MSNFTTYDSIMFTIRSIVKFYTLQLVSDVDVNSQINTVVKPLYRFIKQHFPKKNDFHKFAFKTHLDELRQQHFTPERYSYTREYSETEFKHFLYKMQSNIYRYSPSHSASHSSVGNRSRAGGNKHRKTRKSGPRKTQK